jgi:hypothetical protein
MALLLSSARAANYFGGPVHSPLRQVLQSTPRPVRRVPLIASESTAFSAFAPLPNRVCHAAIRAAASGTA